MVVDSYTIPENIIFMEKDGYVIELIRPSKNDSIVSNLNKNQH